MPIENYIDQLEPKNQEVVTGDDIQSAFYELDRTLRREGIIK
jgi:hypothetical protein